MTRLGRRAFVTGSLAATTLPFISSPIYAADFDVVVVGAGAAGLAATDTLRRMKKNVVCIEAAGRIGGRIHTDQSIFGVPYDMGAHWLHNAATNPFVSHGQDNGFDLYRAPDEDVLYVGDRLAGSDERDAFETARRETYAAIYKAGAAGRDVAPTKVVETSGEWAGTAHQLIGPYEMGKDFSQFSCVDWYNSKDGTDWFCRQGFGAVFAHRWRDLAVETGTVARRVSWGGKGVEIETNKGTLSAKNCIVTVSTGVLAANRIRFDPALPDWKQAAFEGISMGLYNHVALQFRDNFFGIGDDGYVIYRLDGADAMSPRGVGLLVNVGGTNLSLADLGGSLARELESEGQQAATDFALGQLRSIFGADVDKGLIKAHATAWGRNPHVLGSFASAEPGRFEDREALRRPVGKRLFFAGEATSETEWATVAGAHKEGVRVAARVARLV